jgi:hypothetical protein
LHAPAINCRNQQCLARQPAAASKRVDPGQRWSRNGNTDMSDPKLIKDINSSGRYLSVISVSGCETMVMNQTALKNSDQNVSQ